MNVTVKEKRSDKLFCLSLAFFVFTFVIFLICFFSEKFAGFYAGTVSYVLRLILSVVTGVIPFSVAEVCVLFTPVGVILGVVWSVRRIANKNFCVKRFAKITASVVFIALSLFYNVLGVCYFVNPLEETLGLERTRLTRKELYEDAMYTKSMLEKAAEKVTFDKSGASVNPHSYSETDRLINEGYSKLSQSGVLKTAMVGQSKKIMLSPLMTYTHISGMYMPFTGEANVNVNYPDYVVAYTIAHEKAHQRGIAEEDAANFVAFLACMSSGDDYLVYSALMNMYDSFLDETLSKDTEMYTELVDNTDIKIIREMYAYYKFFEKYAYSTASEIAGTVNDTYIKAMGDDDGVKSYGLVIELYHAYIKKDEIGL